MKNNVSTWITVIIMAAVGVIFIVYNSHVDLLAWLVRAIGLVLLVPGIITLITSLNELNNKPSDEKKDTPQRSRSTSQAVVVVSVAEVLVALWMLIAPGFFVHLIVYLFAAALILYGVYTFTTLIYFSKPVKMPWPFYIMPSLSIIAGLMILLTPVRDTSATVTLITGIFLLVIAINTAIQAITYSRELKLLAIPEDHRLEAHETETETTPAS